MPIHQSIDFDKVVYNALSDCNYAVQQWLKGRPHSEEALLNHLTANLVRRRRGCDVGVLTPTYLQSEVYELHRKGPQQKDLYGADLAVTVIFQQESLMKTAFFQLKRSKNYDFIAERSQIEDSLTDSRVRERSFLVAVDENRRGFRLSSTKMVLKKFNGQAENKKFNASSWDCLSDFLWKWLSCDIGPITKFKEPDNIESLMQNFIVEGPDDFTWEEGEPEDYSENLLPARSWVILTFVTK